MELAKLYSQMPDARSMGYRSHFKHSVLPPSQSGIHGKNKVKA